MKRVMALAIVAMGCVHVAAQAPPIKMGLWEKTLVTTGGVGPATLKAKSCVTAAEWQEMVGNSTKEQPGCTINRVKTAHGYSFSGTCTTAHTTMTLSGSATIVDTGHITAETHSTTMVKGQKRQIDTHSESRFLSADCGSVKPGDPEVE